MIGKLLKSSKSRDVDPIATLKKELDAIACNEVKDRTHVRVIGEVKSTRIVPRANGQWLETKIGDGTGKVDGWFFGKKSIAGLNLGAIVLFEGLAIENDGRFAIANPYYEIL